MALNTLPFQYLLRAAALSNLHDSMWAAGMEQRDQELEDYLGRIGTGGGGGTGPPGPPGPVGPAGPAGPPGPGATGYVHNQGATASTWVVVHNLNYQPNVTVEDSAGTTVEGELVHNSGIQLTLTFSAAFSGVAYCS